MKPFFSPLAYFSKRHHHIALLLTMLTIMLGVGLSASPLNVHAATSTSTPSRPPASFKFTVTPDLSQLIGKDANVHVETLTLSATACAALNQAHANAAPTCQLRHYWTGGNHLPLPQAVKQAEPDLAPGWGYWSWSDEVCSIVSCRIWKDNMQEDGVVNPSGTQTWNWNHYCTASGFASQGWCGVIDNGYYTIQYGSNYDACATKIGGCYGHGIRRELSAGSPSGLDTW